MFTRARGALAAAVVVLPLAACGSSSAPVAAALTPRMDLPVKSSAIPTIDTLVAERTATGLSCSVIVSNPDGGDVHVIGSAGAKNTDFGALPMTSGGFTWFSSNLDDTDCTVTINNSAGSVIFTSTLA